MVAQRSHRALCGNCSVAICTFVWLGHFLPENLGNIGSHAAGADCGWAANPSGARMQALDETDKLFIVVIADQFLRKLFQQRNDELRCTLQADRAAGLACSWMWARLV